jgi:hypothetical protein
VSSRELPLRCDKCYFKDIKSSLSPATGNVTFFYDNASCLIVDWANRITVFIRAELSRAAAAAARFCVEGVVRVLYVDANCLTP